jgi:hypothetical protein
MKRLISFICIALYISLFTFAGTWIEPPIVSSADCNGAAHVMCAEYGNTSVYDPVTKTTPYASRETNKSNHFCMIVQDDGGIPYFELVNGSTYGLTSLSGIKNWTASFDGVRLATESNIARTYDGVTAHFDENCNADEMFTVREGNGLLDLGYYEENGVLYRIDETSSTIDDFDLVGTDTSGELLDLGTMVFGSIINSQTGLAVEDVNITFYFDNPDGITKPFFSISSNDLGYYSTLDFQRDIQTYHALYENVSRIPITSYVIVLKHPEFNDKTIVLDTSISPIEQNFEIDPYGVCESDCTYQGSSICRSDCAGINGCNFYELPGGYSLADEMNLIPKTSLVSFSYDSQEYSAYACEGQAFLKEATVLAESSSCPTGTNAWKTERVVRFNGQVAKMIVTYCE